jgi:predicted DNA-binding protein
MSKITARLSDETLALLDDAASRQGSTRAEIVSRAIEDYLDDYEDLTISIERLHAPSDPVLEWDAVKHELLNQD